MTPQYFVYLINFVFSDENSVESKNSTMENLSMVNYICQFKCKKCNTIQDKLDEKSENTFISPAHILPLDLCNTSPTIDECFRCFENWEEAPDFNFCCRNEK